MRVEKSDNKILLWCNADEFEALRDVYYRGQLFNTARSPDYGEGTIDLNTKKIIAVLEKEIKEIKEK